MKRTILITALIIGIFPEIKAQTDADALRYSQTSITGTARYSSMAGAFGALGGDFSSLITNPAGIGIYRSSEFTFSPSLYMSQTNSNFLGNTSIEDKFNFNIPDLGFVYTWKPRNPVQSGWKNWNLGIGLNRLNNFHSNSFYQGYNPSNSLLDNFVETANQFGGLTYDQLDPFNEQLAYNTGLIYHPDTTSPLYVSDHQPGQPIFQTRTGYTYGAMNDWSMTFGGNYNDVLYLGASLGFRSIYYADESTYNEIDKINTIDVLNSFTFQQNFYTRGTGFNFKMGVIARPDDWVRVGAAFKAPTVYYMHDDYNSTMVSNLVDYDFEPQTNFGSFDYTLTTPLTATGSLGFIIAKSGLIGIDYEVVNYSGARFSGADYSVVNDAIRTNYTTVGNLRIGGEYRLQNLSFRLGYANNGSPYNSQAKVSGSDFSSSSYSGGIGLRDSNYFIDLGYVFTQSNQYFQPYWLSYEAVPGVQNKVSNNNLVLTFGVKF